MRFSKYKAVKSFYGDKKFDSKKERDRYIELLFLEKSGKIKDLELQKKFELIPSQKLKNGKTERACNYFADFVYFDNILNKIIVEDTKGFRTPEYIIKRKLMLKNYGIEINEI